MSVVVIERDGILEAWQAVTGHLLLHGKTNNLVVEMRLPEVPPLRTLGTHEPRRLLPKAKRLSDVVNTIWPSGLVARSIDRHDFYRRYSIVYERGKQKRCNRGKWGTYCSRFLKFGEQEVNQVENAIDVLTRWKRRYEAAIMIHVSSAETDPFRARAAPCLQYVQILWRSDDTLDLVAVYRSQDYSCLALGNFLGLASLLDFLCDESGLRRGRLVVHSVVAWLSASKTISRRLKDGT